MRAQGLWNILRSDNSTEYSGNESTEHALKWDTIKDELYKLSLTTNEVGIYTLLARSGFRKASEISRLLNIPKTETYVTLTNLQNKGIVREISGRPVKFEALPFEETFRMLIHKKKDEIKSSEGSLQSLLDIWRSLPPRAIGSTSSQQFQKLKGLHRVYHKVKEMTQKAANELIIMASVKELAQLETYGLMDGINTVMENGVDVSIITEPDCDIIAADDGINVVACSSIQGPLPHIILMDREEMLAITDEDPDSKETMALWTNCSTLCEAIHLFFTYEYSH
ncbi:MAG: TrmB family transcriptional regulator [Nitrososphaerales archaeon]